MKGTLDNSVFEKLHKQEDWLYTNVSALSSVAFQTKADATSDLIQAYDVSQDSPFVVFVNGIFQEHPSRLVDGITIGDGSHGSVATRSNSMIPRGNSDRITIKGGQSNTIHVLHIVSGENAVASFGNVLIYAQEGQSVSVVETNVGAGEHDHLLMPCTEVIAEKNSSVTLVRAIRGSKQTYHLGSLHVEQHASSKVQTNTITLAGKRTRNEVYAYLDGEHCESNFDGMYMLGEHQLVDNHLRIEHNMPNCNSREFYKGVLDANAKSVFTGRIYVKEDAQQTDAKQTNQNILLSDDAEATARPQLEIYADDVACTHGATTGEIDSEAMLYLQTRGIPADAARTLLIYAFLNESLDELTDDTFRLNLVEELLSNLPGGDFIRKLYL
jgi:Fe-S cluster assembly protein SufD